MTTPRVTVPVEPEYTATDYLRLIAEGWEVIESTGSQMTIQNPEDDGPQDLVIDVDAMLSAAPVPEGGAVNHEALAKVGYEASCNKKWEWASRGCKIGWIDAVKAILAALATREEAPAEEGEPKYFAAFMAEDGALRAQPPAREDALPVGEIVLSNKFGSGVSWLNGKLPPLGAKLYTRPAPDALREVETKAVEAMQGAIEWDKARGYRMPYRVRDPLYAALAALQAEQKGGA